MIEKNITDSGFNDPDNPIINNPVEDKPYGHKEVDSADTNRLYQPIPEAKFERPKVDFGDRKQSNSNNQSEQKPLTPEEESTAVKASAQAMISFYADAHELAKYFSKIDTDKVQVMAQKGEINGEQTLELANNTHVTVIEFFQHTNNAIDEVLVVSDDFKREIKPPLERIIRKNKWFISDEVILSEIILRDLSIKAGMIMGIRKTANSVLEMLVEKESNSDKKSKARKLVEEDTSSSKSNDEIFVNADFEKKSNSSTITPEDDDAIKPDKIIYKKRKYTKRKNKGESNT